MTTGRKEIDRTSLRPLWLQIRDVLLREIRSGTLGAEGRLPPAKQLAQRFGVNRHTVRQSLKSLEEAGVTETRQGAGSFVIGPVVEYPISRKTRFSEIVLGQGMEPSGEVLRVETKVSTREVASALQLKKNAKVVLVERLIRADDIIIGIGRHYFPASRLSGVGRAVVATGSVSSGLKKVGVENYFRHATTVSARTPTSREGRLLVHPASRPVLESKAINVDEAGTPIEYGVTIFVGDRVRLKFGDRETVPAGHFDDSIK